MRDEVAALRLDNLYKTCVLAQVQDTLLWGLPHAEVALVESPAVAVPRLATALVAEVQRQAAEISRLRARNHELEHPDLLRESLTVRSFGPFSILDALTFAAGSGALFTVLHLAWTRI